MSLLYKRPNSPFWYVTKTRQSTKTSNRKLAEEFARKSLTEHWRQETLGEIVHTWEALCADWRDVKEDKASYAQDCMVIDRVSALLRRKGITALRDITGDVIQEYAKQAKANSSAATANRHLNTVRAMLNRAYDNEWITRAPTVEAYQVTEVEAGWLTSDQCNSIVPFLPEWVADMYIFAQQTGLRFSNVAGFKWTWISHDGNVAVVPAIQTKTRRTYAVPLSAIAKEILARLRAKALPGAVYAFIGKKRVGAVRSYIDFAPVDSVRAWWEPAREKAGLSDITWHEATRHTWASHHTQNKTPDRILAKMGGWSSTRMLEKYAHLSTDHLVEYADNHNEK